MDRVALDLGFLQIYWYSITMFLGIACATIMILAEAKKQKINTDFMINLIFYGVVFGLLGARLYYVVFNLDYYLSNPVEIFEIWNGGIAIHGAMIFGLLTVLIYTRRYKAKFLKVVDILVVGLILGQAIGRWGNFFNGEAYGPVTTLNYLKSLHIPDFIINGMYINGAYRIPTFLYESVWDFFGFLVLIVARRYKYLKTGWLTGIYLIWYSIGRVFIESFRADSLMLGPFKMAQIVSIVMIIIGVLMLILCKKGNRFDNLYKEKTQEINF